MNNILDSRLGLRCPSTSLEQWRKRAALAGQSLSAWIVSTLDATISATRLSGTATTRNAADETPAGARPAKLSRVKAGKKNNR